MIDILVLVLISLAALFGFIRGIVSQLMAIAGLAAAYLLAPGWGKMGEGFVRENLGCSKFMAGKVSVLLVGALVYLVFRLIGFGIEKLLVNRVTALKGLNRVGGACLGALKAGAIAAVLFFFMALVPRENMHAWFPKVMESRSYQWAARYNPMGTQVVLERMRDLRTSVSDPKKMERLQNSDQVEKILARYELKGALQDKRFVEPFQNGDFDRLAKNEQIEKLMKDDQLTALLTGLEKNAVRN